MILGTLHRLGQKGWLESEWGYTDQARRARFYRLTTAGRRQLTAQLARWTRYTDAAMAILQVDEELRFHLQGRVKEIIPARRAARVNPVEALRSD